MARLGTFRLTDKGVALSRRGQGVLLDVSFKELEVWAARNAIDEKRLWRQSWTRACTTLRRQLQKVVSSAGGYYGVPKFKDFESFTEDLRRVEHKTAPMGGILAEKHSIIWRKVGKTTYIGWPDKLATWADRFQDGVPRNGMFDNPQSRYALHRKGIRDVPAQYVSNPRRVLPEPFGTHAQKHLEEWARGAFYKALARRMAKKRIA